MKKLFLLPAVLLLCASFACAKDKCYKKENFAVSADAEVRIKPNRVALTFGISEETQSLKGGKDKMQRTISSAIAFCKANGIDPKYIQTENIYISPRYKTKDIYNNGKREEKELLYYTLQQTFTVTLEDPSKYDTILYGLLETGLNKVENIKFYSTEMRKYRDQARLAAIKHAQEKAALLTQAAGIKLGKAVNIREDGFHNYSSSFRGGSMFSNVSQNMVQNYDPSSDTDSDLAPGMISVKAAVTLTYELD